MVSLGSSGKQTAIGRTRARPASRLGTLLLGLLLSAAVPWDYARQLDLLGSLKSSRQLLLTWDGERFVPLDFASMQNGQWRVLADNSDVLAVLMNG